MKLFKHTAGVFAYSLFLTTTYAATDVNYEIQPYADIMAGVFHSEKSYQNPADPDPKKTWQELSAKYGVKGTANFDQQALYGSFILTTSGTFGDGDAGNVTNGHERRTNIGEWSLGFKDAPGQQAFSKYNLLIGRQNVLVADGFMVSGDGVNLGKAVANGELDRGGAYYLAARKAFDFTTTLQYRPWERLLTQLYYLKSDNKAQYSAEMMVGDFIYQDEKFGLGGTYLDVLSVDDPLHLTGRDNLKNYALRWNYTVDPALSVKGEYVFQDNARSNENAGYLSLNYNVPDSAYHSALGYRFSHYSEHYDPMFYGNLLVPGGWVQGEVAGNYAGPNNRNVNVHQLSFSMSPKENLMLTALAYKFDTLKKNDQNLSGYEFDTYAVWSLNKHINIIPLIGLYKPKKDIQTGGSQFADNKLNTYTELLFQYTY